MPQASPLTLLLVNEQAEEVKLTTICMRGFYPGCRIEAVYSAEEALEWASKQDWHLILLDEQLPRRSGFDILPDLRRQAPNAVIIVQTARMGTEVATQAAQAGADWYLFKKSPAFLTELPLAAKAALEKRDLRMNLDRAERYLRLIEDMADIVYELDAEGCFVHASPDLLSRLGYSEQDLMGVYYAKVIHPDDRRIAEHRFNERRTGARASRHVTLRLVAKGGTFEDSDPIEIEFNAAGLYDRQQQLLGTVGVVRTIHEKQDHPELHGSEVQRRRLDRLLKLEQSLAPIASDLAQSLAEILSDTETLLKKIQSLQIEPHLQRIAAQTVRATESAKILSALVQPETAEVSASASANVSPERVEQHRQETAASLPSSAGQATDRSASDRPKALPTERRHSPRIDLHAEARLRLNEATWQGRALNISLDGLYMILNGSVTASENQAIQLELELLGGAGILEVCGRVREIRQAAHSQGTSTGNHRTGLAIEFGKLGVTEEMVLASLIDGLREQSISIIVTAFLLPEELRALRLQAGPVSASDQEASVPQHLQDKEQPSLRPQRAEPSELLHEGDAPLQWPSEQRIQALHQEQSAQQAKLWKRDFVEQPACLTSPSDYWRLMDHIYRLVGNLDKGERILDAGCGNGALGAFLLIHEAYRLQIASKEDTGRAHYVGIDVQAETLAHSRQSLDKLATELRGYILAAGMRQPLMKISFCSADLNHALPFDDNQFDRIVCNFVIGYLQDPPGFLRELIRILSPSGRLVLTSLKPQAGVPLMFTNLAQNTGGLEEIEDSQWLWGNLAQIQRAESDGILRPLGTQELTAILTSCGAIQPRIHSAFADQAYIVVASKRDTRRPSH